MQTVEAVSFLSPTSEEILFIVYISTLSWLQEN